MQRFSKENLLTLLTYPLKALCSKDFYFQVLLRMRGTGFLYLLLISFLFAFPACWRSMGVLQFFKSLELPSLVAQLPSAYLDSNGILSPDNDSDAYKLILSSKGYPAVVFNTEGKILEGQAVDAPVEFLADHVKVHTEKGDAVIEYKGLFETAYEFKPVQAAQAVDEVLGASAKTVWSVIVMWFFILLAGNALLSACIGRFLILFVFRIKLTFLATLRLCAYANTVVALLILAQFFIYLPVSYTVMLILPLLYLSVFSRAFRKELERSGLNAFKKKYIGGENSGNNQDEISDGKDTAVSQDQQQTQPNIAPDQQYSDGKEKQDKKDGDGGSGFFQA